jgi:malonyl-ACP decarboxylase
VTSTADAPLVTGIGVLTAIAADADSFTAALRSGRRGIAAYAGPEPGGLAFLSARIPGPDLTQRLADAHLAALPEDVRARARRVVRRASLTAQASVLAALEGWVRAELHVRAADSDRVAVVVSGHNLAGRYDDQSRADFDRNPAFLRPTYALQYQDSNHVAVVSAVLGVTGEGCTVGAASASGNAAIIQAARLLAVGAADVCLVVGALTELSEQQRQGYLNLGAMSAFDESAGPAGQCRPFDAARSGFVPGEGAACLVLETRESAARRGVAGIAELRGYAIRLDADHSAAPSIDGEAAVMSATLAAAGVSCSEIDYINTHGTASPRGDEAEVSALVKVFDGSLDRVWLNSTKALTGHCLSSAGVVEAVATVAQLTSGFVHSNPNLAKPIAPLRFTAAAAVDADLEIAMSNGFGFGGFNTSLVFRRIEAGHGA